MQTSSAVLGVTLQLMLHVRRRRILGMAMEHLERSTAALAPELRIVIYQSIGNHLHLPERLVTAGGFDAPTLHFTLIKLFTFDCHGSPQCVAGAVRMGSIP